MAPFRTVFMGSPEFALPSLRRLCEVAQVVAVVTQPDRKKGRGQALAAPPVKVEAEGRGIPVLQPAGLKAPEVIAQIAGFEPELIVVVAYGRILPPEVLEVPPLGCLNVHASLLPRYRGAAPINWAIIRGEAVTGVTIMQMEAGLDTGPVLLQKATPIGPEETAAELGPRLAEMGAKLLAEALQKLGERSLYAVRQNDEAATYAPPLRKGDGAIVWAKSAQEVCRLVRGVQPWPGAYTFLRGRLLKVFGCRLVEGEATSPGEVLGLSAQGLVVSAGEGRLSLAELQAEGGKRLAAERFLLGHPVPAGTVLGTVGLKR